MYDDYDLDYININDHCLDEDSYYEHYSRLESYDDNDEDYDRCDNDYQDLAYKHYAWYNTSTILIRHMLAQKRLVTVTLDIACYDDLDIDKLDWRDLLGLEGGEEVDVTIREIDPFFWFIMPDTYDFSGDLVTVLGLVGILSTAVILFTAYRKWWSSPYRRWHFIDCPLARCILPESVRWFVCSEPNSNDRQNQTGKNHSGTGMDAKSAILSTSPRPDKTWLRPWLFLPICCRILQGRSLSHHSRP